MVKLPAGSTTSSGQLAHSRKLSFGLSAHSSAADSGAAPRDDGETVLTPPQGAAAAGGTTSGPTTGGTGGTIPTVVTHRVHAIIVARRMGPVFPCWRECRRA